MDIVSLICKIVLCGEVFVGFWLAYLWYLDKLWNIENAKRRAKGVKWPIEPPEDVEYRDVARFD